MRQVYVLFAALLSALCLTQVAEVHLAGAQPSAYGDSSSQLVAAMDSAAEAHAADSTVAGAAVAVVQRGDTLLLDGYGQADLEFDVPMPKDAVFEIGSVTKQFTAAAILQLAAKDSVDLDAPITEYLTGYDTRGHRVTVRHLLYHTSGIRNFTNMSQFWDLARQELPQDTLLSLVEAKPFRFAPGTRMSYSNTGYILLGRIIEKASGKSYGEYVEEHLFEPAEMEDSYYCDEYAVDRHKAHGYNRWNEKKGFRHRLYANHDWPYAAGSLCSTAGDLVAWTRALHGGQVLSDSMYQVMTRPGHLADGTKLRYAMGLAVFQSGGRPVIGHGGNLSGFLSDVRYYPEEELTIVVLQNTNGPHPPQALLSSLTRLVLGEGKEPKESPYDGDLSELAGRYVGPGQGTVIDIEVQAKNGHLLTSERGTDTPPDTLWHAGGLTWGAPNRLQYGTDRYRFVRAGEHIVELRWDEVFGHYVLRRVGDL